MAIIMTPISDKELTELQAKNREIWFAWRPVRALAICGRRHWKLFSLVCRENSMGSWNYRIIPPDEEVVDKYGQHWVNRSGR
jgi:hypothetical protein